MFAPYIHSGCSLSWYTTISSSVTFTKWVPGNPGCYIIPTLKGSDSMETHHSISIAPCPLVKTASRIALYARVNEWMARIIRNASNVVKKPFGVLCPSYIWSFRPSHFIRQSIVSALGCWCLRQWRARRANIDGPVIATLWQEIRPKITGPSRRCEHLQNGKLHMRNTCHRARIGRWS